MAKKTTGISLRTIIDDIRKGNFAPVYILHGEEPYYIDLICENIEKFAVDESDRDFNVDIFYGNDADPDYVVASAQQLPVMAPRKLVILKEAQGMQKAKTQLEKFASYVMSPNMSAIFVIAYKGEPLGATTDLLKAAKKSGGVIYLSEQPADYQLYNVVRDYCTEHRISIEDKALQMMVESIGTPLSKFYGELTKLVSIKGKGNRITAADVEKNIGISKDFTNFELVDAVAEKNYPKAMKIVRYFAASPKANGKNAHGVLTASILYNFFSNLVAAHYAPDKSEAGIMSLLGLRHPIQMKAINNGLRNYTAMKAVNAIHYIRDFDTKSKGIDSMQSDSNLIGELIFKIFT